MSVTTVNLGKLRVNWRGAFAGSTAYTVNDAVSYSGSSYICVNGYTSTSSFPTDLGAGYWQLMAQGNSANTTTGDITYRASTGSDSRLGIGTAGQVLTVGPTGIPEWEYGGITGTDYYVSPNGSDTYAGTTLNRAFATVRHACATITGPATLYIKAGTYYEQLPITVPPQVTIVGDGMRDTVIAPLAGTVTATFVSMTSTTLVVSSTSGIGPGMTVTGTGFTGSQTVIAVVNGTTLTLSATYNAAPTGTLTFTYLSTDLTPVPNQNSTMFLMSDQTMLSGVLMLGMTGFAASGSFPADFTQATVGGVFLRLNPASPILTKSPYIKDCTAKSSGGVGAIVDGSVHASGNRSMLFWAYNQVHDNGVGLVVCNLGKAEAVSCFTYYCYFGYFTYGGGIIRSLSGNNSYGVYGCVSQGYDSTESPVTGTVYGNMLTYSTLSLTGTFTQGEVITQPYASAITTTAVTGSSNTATITYATQGSAPYTPGQTIIVAGVTPSGYNGTYTVATSTTTQTTYTLTGAGGLGNGTIQGTIKGVASGYVTSVQTGFVYYKQTYGVWNTSTTLTGSSSGATMTPTVDGGQANYLLVLNNLSASPQVGASIQFTSGDTNAYVIQGVSTATVNSVSLTIITLAQQKAIVSVSGVTANIRYNFSNIRLTGHDFLSIGTGGVTTTNYPNIPTQAANSANQTIWTFPGRIYYVSTDQSGNFSVGQYFSVNQATGAATLNASAFNLSGLTSLRLGTLGAQLGAQINEFSTDGTMSQNSPVKVPTQSAVTTYLGAAYQTIAPATSATYDLGSNADNWRNLYVSGTGNFGTAIIGSGGLTINGNLTVNGTTTAVNNETGTSFLASNGLVSAGSYAGTYTDGIVVDYITGNGRISVGTNDGFTFYNNTDSARAQLLAISSTGIVTVGTAAGYSDTGILATFANTTAGYNQIILQNKSANSNASTNFNVSNDSATATTNYGEFGMNSSLFSGGASAFAQPGYVYLAAATTDLVVGTYNANAIHFVVASGTSDAATISSAGVFSTTSPAFTTSITTPSTTFSIAPANASTVNIGPAGVTTFLGANTGNSTLSVLGNGISGTATITTNVTSGTANVFAGVTGTVVVGATGSNIYLGGTTTSDTTYAYVGNNKVATMGRSIAMAMVFGG